MSQVHPGSRCRAAASPSALLPAVSLGLVLALGVVGVRVSEAQTPPHAAPSGPPAGADVADDQEPVVTDAMDDLEFKEPPDGKWLKDADGREYFVTRLKKVKNSYTRLEPKLIVYRNFHRFEIDHEDAEYFYIRYYRGLVDDEKVTAERERKREERLAQIKESYRFDERSVDRLSFTPYDQGLPRRGQWRQGLEVADMNGDGFVDIVHGPPRKGAVTPQIFLGNGAGSWRLWSEASWPPLPLDYGDIAVGDVNGDGLLDLALGIHLRGIKVLVQSEPGKFVDSSEGLPFDVPGKGGDASGFSSRALKLADWNGDHKLDLIALGEGPRQRRSADGKGEGLPTTTSFGLVVFVNQGSDGWKALSGGNNGGIFGDSFAVGDLNGDRRPDAATVSYTLGNRNILHLNSDDEGIGWTTQEITSLRPQAWVFGITAGDFDGDGRDDVVTSFASHDGDMQRRGLELSRRDAKGAWETRLIVAFGDQDNLWSLASGDLDGDGNRDLVASSERGYLLVFLGDGRGGFAREEAPEIDPPVLCRGYGIQVADVDGDHRAEIVASFAGEAETLLEFLGTTKCQSGGAIRVWRSAAATQP